MSKRKEIEIHNIQVKLVDFSKDKHEPAFDVEVWIDEMPVLGGGPKQIFGIGTKYLTYQYPTKKLALKAAKQRVNEILTKIKGMSEE